MILKSSAPLWISGLPNRFHEKRQIVVLKARARSRRIFFVNCSPFLEFMAFGVHLVWGNAQKFASTSEISRRICFSAGFFFAGPRRN
jgi:hypothetical protein